LSNLRVYAPLMTGLSGMDSLVGYADDPELGMVNLAIGDPNAASHTLVAVLAALFGRGGGGGGIRIDIPQVGALLAPMIEAIAEHQVGGRDPRLRAARPPDAAPWGHFPCAGDSRWIAITVESDDQWSRLAGILGGRLGADRYSRAADRARSDELDGQVAARTRAWDRDELFQALLEGRVPAAPVHDLDEMLASEQLRARGLFVEAMHPYSGRHDLVRTPWTLSATPATPRASAPLVGEHTDEVLREVLGLSNDELRELHESGALD
jgi:benzylsuccinate CoA-transferase BbsF subunit